MIKIAVALDEEGRISAHFGHSAAFEVFEVEKGAIKSRQTITPGASSSGECACQGEYLLSLLKGAEKIICGGMGKGAFNKLQAQGLEPILVDVEMDPRKAVQSLLDGSLKPVENQTCGCGGHDHGALAHKP